MYKVAMVIRGKWMSDNKMFLTYHAARRYQREVTERNKFRYDTAIVRGDRVMNYRDVEFERIDASGA